MLAFACIAVLHIDGEGNRDFELGVLEISM